MRRVGHSLAFAVLLLLQSETAGSAENISYLDNGVIRVGVNLNLGGSITYLSKSGGSTNLVNNADWGRQIQMSHYSGPVPFIVGNKRPPLSSCHCMCFSWFFVFRGRGRWRCDGLGRR